MGCGGDPGVGRRDKQAISTVRPRRAHGSGVEWHPWALPLRLLWANGEPAREKKQRNGTIQKAAA